MNRKILSILLFVTLLFACEKPPQEIPVSSVSLNQATAEMIVGETVQLSATVLPSNATDKTLSWASSKQSVATVSGSGLVTALAEGSSTITVFVGGKSATCQVTVEKKVISVTSVTLDKTELTLKEGEEANLVATVKPEDASDKTITWSSSDDSVATVESGKVKALKEGTVTITASAGAVKAECMVTVFLKYGKFVIADLRPVDILPVIGQVTAGDPKVYNYVEHLRIAEATRIIDMMWDYGAGQHPKEEYQQLMRRLNTGMTHEIPFSYDNFEFLGTTEFYPGFYDTSYSHADFGFSILNLFVKHAHFIVPTFARNPDKTGEQLLLEYVKANPNTINIFGQSASAKCDTKEQYDLNFIQDPNGSHTGAFELYECRNYIHFAAGTNLLYEDHKLRKSKIFNGDYEADEYGMYSTCSMANSDKNTRPGSHLLVTIGTNATGDVDVDSEDGGSKYPVGFADNVLFAGRAFIGVSSASGLFYGVIGTLTSYLNYYNVAMMDICFQMYAEVRDVDELLEMVRSTALTNYISLENNTQPLQLINPAGLYKKYLTPQNLPASITPGETISLDKGYYKGVLFSIPGAEVKVDGEWIAFDNKNKEVILSQNPMTLEWRLNGDLLKKYGYTSGQAVEGQIITVDDKWGGLRLEVPMTIQVR